jgi:STE24 endopeptidase
MLPQVLGLLSNVVSRAFEFQADAFAVGLGKGTELRGALCALDKENKGAVCTDSLYSAYHYSHPPLVERLAAIDAGTKKES